MNLITDVILYNNAHGSPSVSSITSVCVTSDGIVTWQPPVKYDSFCSIDIEWYPYDLQTCELKFGSWSHSGEHLDIIHLRNDNVILENNNGETVWKVERGVDLSEFQAIDITYYLVIRRQKLFYTVYMMLPCACIAALTGWVYYLPCESNEKNTLCISILVSLTFYFLMLVDIIPPTSLVTPFIIKYLNFTLFMVALSICLTVFVQEVHHRRADQPMPPRIRKIFINWLGKKLLISRKTEMANLHREAAYNKQANALSAMSILERQFQKTLFDIEMATKRKTSQTMQTVKGLFMELPMMNRSKSFKPQQTNPVKSPSRLRRLLSIDLGPTAEDLVKPENISEPQPSIPEERRPSTLPPDPVRDRLRRAERNVHFIAQTLTERRRKEEVIDRILLIIFNIVLTVGTVIAMISAPSITGMSSSSQL
ncbi:hypothetical protein WR25_21914 isoform B [Diploscapter pachys]|uniref:Neurotransmitter-gated ion-channel ligand-binding domain-containing protein n=1 Tax=Diploscapter pachys TaxID=2018661 RepID=A0A2A2LYX8_9BILA|nr:hypothetical protein WR25_21914 isoform A [Diploscapter pachys]PAV91333.1 hypothetical protein WR25_21914 isoform B [Diploscapter pachys]